MTTETPPLDEQDTAEAPADATASAGAEPIEPTEPPKTPFWQRPAVERYLVPFVLPLVVVLGLIMLVLNISRIFLSLHGNVDVLVGSAILLTILIGAAILSSSRMRSSSLTLVTGSFIFALLMFGWLSLGSAEEEGEGGATLEAEGPAAEALAFTSNNSFRFVPDAAPAQTGIAAIQLTNEGGEHTFVFEDGETLFDTLAVNAAGDQDAARAYFGEEGDYIFYCSVPGHREAGMEGAIAVTGDPVTLEEAEAAAVADPAAGEERGEGGVPADERTEPDPEEETEPSP